MILSSCGFCSSKGLKKCICTISGTIVNKKYVFDLFIIHYENLY